jgi:nucleotide-binding universal stress UspA family protein
VPGPIVIAYDGSDLARAAIRHAAELFPERSAIVATVWEPGLAIAFSAPMGETFGAGVPPDPETVAQVDRAEQDHATTLATQGAELARSLGLAAEPHAVPDEADVAETIVELARDREAAAVVVGSHGISRLRRRWLGGVSRRLIEHCDRPVLVVRS